MYSGEGFAGVFGGAADLAGDRAPDTEPPGVGNGFEEGGIVDGGEVGEEVAVRGAEAVIDFVTGCPDCIPSRRGQFSNLQNGVV